MSFVLAQAQAAVPAPGWSDGPGVVRTLVSLMVVLGLLAGCLWLIRRGGWQGGRKGPRAVQTETAVGLGDRRQLVIVAGEGRRLPLGLTPMPVGLVTVLSAAGQFVLFSYFAPYYKQAIAITPGQLSLLFVWFGVFGLVGNVLMTRYIERIGAHRAVMIAIASMALAMLVWPLGTSLLLAALVSIPWALGCFSSNSAQQARLVGIAPALAAGSIALNSSAMYAGQALGAASGGALIARGGMGMLHWAGFALLLMAMAASAWAASHRTSHRSG